MCASVASYIPNFCANSPGAGTHLFQDTEGVEWPLSHDAGAVPSVKIALEGRKVGHVGAAHTYLRGRRHTDA